MLSAQGLTLTETTAGASLPRVAAASLRTLASRGQKSRQSGSMKVTIAGRPWSDASVSSFPFSSWSAKAGAGRTPAGQVAVTSEARLGSLGASAFATTKATAAATRSPAAAMSHRR